MNYNLIRSIPNQHMDSHRGMVYLMHLKSQNVSSVNERLRERMKLVLSSCSFWYYNVLLAFRLPLQMGDQYFEYFIYLDIYILIGQLSKHYCVGFQKSGTKGNISSSTVLALAEELLRYRGVRCMQSDLIRQCSESVQGAMWVLAKGALSWNDHFCCLAFTVLSPAENLYVHHLMFKIIPI